VTDGERRPFWARFCNCANRRSRIANAGTIESPRAYAQQRGSEPPVLHRFGAAASGALLADRARGSSGVVAIRRSELKDDGTMLFGLLVFGAIVSVVFAFVAIYNGLVAAAEKATRAWNELDVLLRQRHDEIPKLVETCEPHMRSERAALDGLLEARTAVFSARQTRNADELGRAEAALRSACAALMTRAAEQASLAASPAFALLRQRQITLDLELKDRRDRYNEAVRRYNAAISRVPGSVVALVGAFRPLRPLDFEPAGP
jgi:LemA protein